MLRINIKIFEYFMGLEGGSSVGPFYSLNSQIFFVYFNVLIAYL